MDQNRKSRGVKATAQGLKELEVAKATQKCDEGNRLTYERIAEKANISDKTVQRFFSGKSVDLDCAISIIEALNLNRQDILLAEDILVSEALEKIENQDAGDSKRAHELIEQLESEFNQLKKSADSSAVAMDWLKANRRPLSWEAAQTVLEKFYDKKIIDSEDDHFDEIDIFAEEIRMYLQLIYCCLEVGTWEVMDEAIKMQEELLPVNRNALLYAEALEFIKDQKIGEGLKPEETEEIELCLDYLIKTIPVRF